MITENKETKPEQVSRPEGTQWNQMLAGFIYIVTGLLIIGFILQSI